MYLNLPIASKKKVLCTQGGEELGLLAFGTEELQLGLADLRSDGKR